MGPNVVLTNAKYPLSPGAKDRLKGPIIKSGAKIGANSSILPGVVIGENALVGAGAVVTKDVQDFALMAGIPAKRIGWVCKCGVTLKVIDTKDNYQCKGCGNNYTYSEKDGILNEVASE